MEFLIPREPRLRWSMLYPRSSKRECQPLRHGQRTYHVFWARNAIYHGLKALGVSPGDTVLVPALHCATAVESILRYGARVKFYNIHRDCSPDFCDIQAKIDKKSRAVLAIHYFGLPQPIRRFQEMCEDHHLYLIEDCAHVLTAEAGDCALGTYGDISVFSWRKFLPLYDGGHLVINNPNLHLDVSWEKGGFLFFLKVTKNILDKLIDDSSGKAISAMSHLLRFPYSIGRGLLSTNESQPRAFTINNYGLDFDPSVVDLEMSALSRYILRNVDIPAIVEKRRLNYAYLLNALKWIPRITAAFPDLPENVCPWVFPVFAHGQQNFHVTLRSKGIPAFTWGGVVHPELDLEEFPEADFLYQNLVFLPIHQSISDLNLQTILEVIAKVLAREN